MAKKSRTNYSESIRAMELGVPIFIKDANARSVQTICTQIALEFTKKRKYFTAAQNGGIKVWRVE